MRSISVRRFHKWGMALAVAVTCSLPALAQESRGQFTIPREVHWGSLVFPAGSYSYSVEHHASEVVLLRSKSGGSGHFLLATAVSRPEIPGPNQLTLEQRGTDWYVTSMVVNDFGEVLIFQAPTAETIADSRPKLATIASK
jgi:hypothetical protein